MPCANHLLNLCGVHSFGTVTYRVTFFGTLENYFTFSQHRLIVGRSVENCRNLSKRLRETRWSAHHDAAKIMIANVEKIVEAIEALCSPEENIDIRGSAQV
ncbi:hypothetical protein PR048_023917 [Dryococelus australis]|uniref:Uncharacterized protein n=1 Tax=Dryococelus australis TaxID=614101 RepID=A0ABQ9GVL6_9NEOP|nr:hypothetical protein PR048_023917 [Dryococelus australis]